jgi:tellurite resistance protein
VSVAGIETASAASAAGWMPLARLCLGAGLLGWAAFGALTLARQILRPLPPPRMLPTAVIDAVIAAAVGVAYFNVYGPHPSGFAYTVAGYGLVMGAAQIRLLPRYLSAPFTPGTWVFAFAAAVTATDVMRWLSAIHSSRRWSGWLVLAVASALVALIGARTLIAIVRPVHPEEA